MKRSTRRRQVAACALPLVINLPIWVFYFGRDYTLNGMRPFAAMAVSIGAVALLILVWYLFGRALHHQMTEKGYRRLGLTEAQQLYIALGGRFHQIPPRDQLATLPGYKEGDIESIIDLMERAAPRR